MTALPWCYQSRRKAGHKTRCFRQWNKILEWREIKSSTMELGAAFLDLVTLPTFDFLTFVVTFEKDVDGKTSNSCSYIELMTRGAVELWEGFDNSEFSATKL